jgi:hypothetical protein
MARRRTNRRKLRTRRRKPAFNIVNAAELYAQTAVITHNVMGTNPLSALTGIEYGQTGMTGGNQFGKGGTAIMGYGYMPQGASVTVPELLGIGDNASFGQGSQVIKDNFKANLMPMLIQTIGVRAGFAIGKKLLSKQRSFINTKVLDPIGLGRTVRV